MKDLLIEIYVAIISIPIMWKMAVGRYFVFRDSSDFIVNYWASLNFEEDEKDYNQCITQARYEKDLRTRKQKQNERTN